MVRTIFVNQKALIVLIIALNVFLPKTLLADKQVIGGVEAVWINNLPFSLSAKIDTGAKNSSLNAVDYALLDRGPDQWVRFQVTNKKGKTIVMEKRVVRTVKIKRKGADLQERPVIELDVCLGNIKKRVEVNLVDRKKFNYQMLIGRSFLNDHFVVDVDKVFSIKPDCKK